MGAKTCSYKQSTISYIRFGTGQDPVVCLHGFNESAQSFSVLGNPNNQYSIIAIDAPFHGNTIWKQGHRFTPAGLHEIIHSILKIEGFHSEISFTLLGFSLGGRISLAYYELYPKEINRLILIAPDGLTQNFWYWWAAHTKAGNRIFAATMKRPGWFLKMAGTFNKLGLTNTGVKKFVVHYLGNEQIRQTLYDVWTAFRYFKPNIPAIKKLIALHQTPVQLYFGKYDNVIPAKRGAHFIKGIESFAQINILEAGHRLLQNKTVQEVLNNLFVNH